MSGSSVVRLGWLAVRKRTHNVSIYYFRLKAGGYPADTSRRHIPQTHPADTEATLCLRDYSPK